MRDRFELFLSNIYWYGYLMGRGIGLTLTFLMPILFGSLVGKAYEDVFLTPEPQYIWSWAVWYPYRLILLIVGIWIVGYVLLRFYNHKDKKSKELHNVLKWLCESLDTQQDTDKDIRCTIWIPVGRMSQGSPVRLLQAVDYFPKHSPLPDRRNFHKNGNRFRVFKVATKEDSTLKPIGVLGKAAFDSIIRSEPNIYHESFTSQKPFIEHMVNNWNFTRFQAERLTQDRKSYLCFAMTNRDRNELLGIIYFDSRQTHALDVNSNNIVPMTEAMLPLFANIITSR